MHRACQIATVTYGQYSEIKVVAGKGYRGVYGINLHSLGLHLVILVINNLVKHDEKVDKQTAIANDGE